MQKLVRNMKHKVRCAVCGLKGVVQINNKTRKTIGNWFYYGKININYYKTDKYFYKILSWEPEFITERIANEKYDKNAKRKLLEHWECRKCIKE